MTDIAKSTIPPPGLPIDQRVRTDLNRRRTRLTQKALRYFLLRANIPELKHKGFSGRPHERYPPRVNATAQISSTPDGQAALVVRKKPKKYLQIPFRSFIQKVPLLNIKYIVWMAVNNTMPLTHVTCQFSQRPFRRSFCDRLVRPQIKPNKARCRCTIPQNTRFMTVRSGPGCKRKANFRGISPTTMAGKLDDPSQCVAKRQKCIHMKKQNNESRKSHGKKSLLSEYTWMKR